LDLGSHPDFVFEDEEEIEYSTADSEKELKNYNDAEVSSDIFVKQEKLVNAFLKGVSVAPDRESRLVIISFESKDKTLAALAVNTLADEYIEWNLENKLDVTKSAGASLRTQLEELKKKLEKTQNELSDYAKKWDIVSLDKSLNLTYKQLGELNDAFAKAQTARLSKQALYEEIKTGNEEFLPEVIDDPSLRELKLQYIQVRSQYDTLDATFGPNYPEMKQVGAQLARIKSEIDNQHRDIKRSIEKGYKSAKKKEEILWARAKEQKERAAQLNEVAIQYNALKQEVDTNKTIYQNLLQRLKETEVTSGIRATNVKVIDYAFPPLGHFKPNIIFNMLIAAWMGLLGGVLLAFVFEHFDKTIRDEEEIKKRFPLPFMGKIPNAEKYELEGLEKVAFTKPLSKISEAFRVLKTSILYSSPDHKPPKALLVTSTQPKEGKTTISTNLALSLVQSGLKVVLIDADLRNPSLHNLFLENGNKSYGNDFGLSTYLDGKTDYKSIINSTNYGGLDLIPAGKVLPNPADLIDSKRMKDLIRQLVKDYDNVILDGIPIMELADTRLLSRQVDSVLLVASVGIAQRHELKNSIEELVKIGARIIGVVVNRLEMPKKAGEEYYYFYNSEENKPHINGDDRTYGVSGKLEDTNFAQLLSKFHHEKSFGQLHIKSDIDLNIYFIDGYIQFVEYDDPNLRIGKLLVENKTITVKDQERAIEYTLKSDLKFGEALIKLDKISPHELSNVLELQLKLKLLNGFKNTGGFYGFKYSSQVEVNSIFRIDPIQVIYDAVNNLYIYDAPSSNDSYNLGFIKSKKELKSKIKELKLISSIKQIQLAELIESNGYIKDIVTNSPLEQDETFKFLKFLELAELITIEHSENNQTDEDLLSESIILVSENDIEKRINDKIKESF
ncbi:MAG: GumC family protein, partial [Thermodesulfobacteriota bacterium]